MSEISQPRPADFVNVSLKANVDAAAALLAQRGWTPSSRGPAAAAGALTVPQAMKAAGQWGLEVYFNRELLRAAGRADTWWKQPERTQEEVLESLAVFRPDSSGYVKLIWPR